MYGSGGVVAGNSNRDGRNSVGSDKEYEERAEPVLVLPSDSYLLLDSISVDTSGPSFCSI